MKLKGENEEQIALATQIRDCNTEILNQLKAFVKDDKAWPAAEKDDDAGKETKARYKKQALAGIELLATELKNPEAAYYLTHGAERPMVDSRLLREVVASAKAKDREELEHQVEKLETAIGYFFNDPAQGAWSYKTMIPKYDFQRVQA